MQKKIFKYKDQRVAILIDVQNLYHSARSLYQKRVNFKEVLKAARADRQLVRAVAYVVTTKAGTEKAFLEALEKIGIEIRERPLQEFYGGAKKANWDVGMVVDAIRFAEVVDVIIVVSGDGDFVHLVDYLKNRGRQVEVLAFGRSTSSQLIEAADDFIDLGASKKFLLASASRK
ncbi:MAG: NYN domain-containing protein [Candidatus Niyogibacteria bacterium]|nr:NYN domain-containing protein [Candidatus Niyogibacteria bacterium]